MSTVPEGIGASAALTNETIPAHPIANDQITNARFFMFLPSLYLRLHDDWRSPRIPA
jgi:hypothetical protein